eukprot:UN09032
MITLGINNLYLTRDNIFKAVVIIIIFVDNTTIIITKICCGHDDNQ